MKTRRPPSASRIDVDALGLIGLDCDTAVSTARDAGIDTVSCQPGDAAPSADQVGLVYRYDPRGELPASQVLTLTVYADQTQMPTPANPTLPASVITDSTVQVDWSQYSCPSGTGAVSSFNLTATNGTFVENGQSSASFGPNVRNAQIKVSGSAGQNLLVTYTVTCSGNGQQRDSGASGEANAQITAAPSPSSTP